MSCWLTHLIMSLSLLHTHTHTYQDPDSLPPSLAAFSPTDPGLVIYTGFGVEKELSFYSLSLKQVPTTLRLNPHARPSLLAEPCMSFSHCLRLLRRSPCLTGPRASVSPPKDIWLPWAPKVPEYCTHQGVMGERGLLLCFFLQM